MREKLKRYTLRKAECKIVNTVVKSFVPPQFFERFSALNRICATRRSEDSNLKTQLRFGEKDLLIFSQGKGECRAVQTS